MRKKKIKTGKKVRLLYIASPEEAFDFKVLKCKVDNIIKQDELYKKRVLHGFLEARSCVTNATQHVGYAYSLCFDLKDFFESVTADHVEDWMAAGIVDGAARQGLSSSPALSNYAAMPMDKSIIAFIRDNEINYTRYADDLSFSFNNKECRALLEKEIPLIVQSFDFRVNERKTLFQSAAYGRRNITGVMVDYEGVHPTRRIKRRLRAAKHQNKESHAQGLEEWCKLRLPGGYHG